MVDARRTAAPGDLLPMDAELTDRLDSIRWGLRTGPLVDGLIEHLGDDQGEPQEVLTSLDRLATATGRDADDVRIALTGSARPVTPRWSVEPTGSD
nr:DUF6042 family protein [Streptomyces galilaeus]